MTRNKPRDPHAIGRRRKVFHYAQRNKPRAPKPWTWVRGVLYDATGVEIAREHKGAKGLAPGERLKAKVRA